MTDHTEPSLLKIAIVGSGPAGLYAATDLLKRSQNVRIDILETLPVPFGLLRFGVAPDHQHTRSVCRVFARPLADPRIRFLGGIEIGDTLTIADIQPCYHAVIIATGSQHERRLGIPGGTLSGCHSAMGFVGWVNGHPGFCDSPVSLATDTAAIIGNGNVALDVARLLLSDPDGLAETDIYAGALAALRQSQVRTVTVIGRRGAAQASFSEAELREVVSIPGCAVAVEWGGVEPDKENPICAILLEALETRPQAAEKRIVFRFLESPLRLQGESRVEELVLARNSIAGSVGGEADAATDETTKLRCGLVIESIGQAGVALSGIPFDDDSATIPTAEGRVVSDGQAVPGLYATGWIARGARGLIGHSKRDAKRVADSVWADRNDLGLASDAGVDGVLKAKGIVSVAGL